jgi:hypothetical protein
MPTYKLGQATQSGLFPPTFRRPLICEQCLEAMGQCTLRGPPRTAVQANGSCDVP